MDGATVFILCLTGALAGVVVYLAILSRRNAALDGVEPPGQAPDGSQEPYRSEEKKSELRLKNEREHIAIYGSGRIGVRR